LKNSRPTSGKIPGISGTGHWNRVAGVATEKEIALDHAMRIGPTKRDIAVVM
jgi:hypothetical protein